MDIQESDTTFVIEEPNRLLDVKPGGDGVIVELSHGNSYAAMELTPHAAERLGLWLINQARALRATTALVDDEARQQVVTGRKLFCAAAKAVLIVVCDQLDAAAAQLAAKDPEWYARLKAHRATAHVACGCVDPSIAQYEQLAQIYAAVDVLAFAAVVCLNRTLPDTPYGQTCWEARKAFHHFQPFFPRGDEAV